MWPGDRKDSAPRPDLTQRPDFEARYGSQTAEVYDFQGILSDARAGETTIYNRSDFNSPITNAAIRARSLTLESGNQGLGLLAEIKYETNPTGHDPLAPLRASFDYTYGNSHPAKDGELTIRDTVFSNVFMTTSSSGGRFMIWVDSANSRVVISNNLKLNGSQNRQEQSVSVTPSEIDSVDQQKIMEDFLRIFMRTADIVHEIDDPRRTSFSRKQLDMKYNPIHSLRKNHKIGKERVVRETTQNPNPQSQQPQSGSDQITQTTQQTSEADTDSAAVQPPEKTLRDTDGENQDEDRFEIIEPRYRLEDIGGLEHVKREIRDIARSLADPQAMQDWGVERPHGILLHGLPGTGKTMMVHALASEIGAKVMEITADQVYESFLGASMKNMRAIFEKALATKEPLILFFDEFESIIGVPSEISPGGADNERASVAGFFKQQTNNLSEKNPNVILAVATNFIDRIDPSLIRSGRFNFRLHVPMPDQEARIQIIDGIIKKATANTRPDFQILAENVDLEQIADALDGLSGADIAEILRRPRFKHATDPDLKNTPISQEELLKEIENFKLQS